ncbi:MAG: orotidine 5'-phosphate decarboxylase / HUMPS family protein, partial [Patescibacteria group bacterium]
MNVSERLVIDPEELVVDLPRAAAYQRILKFAHGIRELGPFPIKLEAILRAAGYQLIEALHVNGIQVMADLKLSGTPIAMSRDGQYLRDVKPEIVTAMISPTGVEGLKRLRDGLHPDTELFGVTVLTTTSETAWHETFPDMTIQEAVLTFAEQARVAGLTGLVLSGRQLAFVRKTIGDGALQYLVTGVRSAWSVVPDDDQKQSVTPTEAFAAGASRIVVGRPIAGVQDPR